MYKKVNLNYGRIKIYPACLTEKSNKFQFSLKEIVIKELSLRVLLATDFSL